MILSPPFFAGDLLGRGHATVVPAGRRVAMTVAPSTCHVPGSRPGRREVISCRVQPFPSGSSNEAYEL